MKTTLNNSVFSGLWFNQSLPCSIEVCEHSIKIRIKDQFIQKGHKIISQGGKLQFIVLLEHRLALKVI